MFLILIQFFCPFLNKNSWLSWEEKLNINNSSHEQSSVENIWREGEMHAIYTEL